MFLKERSGQVITKIIVRLLKRLKTIIDENDLDPNIYKLQLNGFNLEEIQENGHAVTGIFRHNDFIKEVRIPFYKINEDVLDQLDNLVEEYNLYLKEQQNKIYESKRMRIKSKDIINLNSEEINWNKIYSSRTYAQILLNTAVELLYFKLNEGLEINK